jgi:hypothetical protein
MIHMHTKSRRTLLFAVTLLAGAALAGAVRLSASDPGSGDWPMWGGKPDRNMVSTMKASPSSGT